MTSEDLVKQYRQRQVETIQSDRISDNDLLLELVRKAYSMGYNNAIDRVFDMKLKFNAIEVYSFFSKAYKEELRDMKI
jgi:hypothetical protein